MRVDTAIGRTLVACIDLLRLLRFTPATGGLQLKLRLREPSP